MNAILRTICLVLFVIFGTASSWASSSDDAKEEARASRSNITVDFEGSAEDRKELAKFLNLVFVLCKEIYPKLTFKDCMNNVKEGVGNSFDPHTGFLNAEKTRELLADMRGRFGGIGIEIFKPATGTSYVDIVNVLSDTPAKKAGLASGDVIVRIGTVPTTSLKGTQKAVELIRGDPGTTVELTIERKGVPQPIMVTLVREEIKIVQIEAKLLRSNGKTYALLTTRMFNEYFAKEMKQKYLELKWESGDKLSGLIISLENNPGGRLDEVYNAVDLFMDAETFLLQRTNEGTVRYEPGLLQRMKTPGDISRGLPILVVVNGGSASASEIFAGALKHFGRAVIAGTETTFGKCSVQSLMSLPGEEMAKATTAECLIGAMNDWVPIQCVGVTPDILFAYPGIKSRKGPKECELSGRLSSGGPMKDAPKHPPIKEVKPGLHRAAEEMLETFKLHRLPKLKEEETRIKLLEKLE